MPRTAKLSHSEAITAAMEAFWAFGYGALGTRQLETETGITRFSLQTTFGGKEKLFLAALDQYLDISEQLIAPRMTDGSLDTIARWFEARPKGEGLPAVSCNGCMMIAAMAEFHGDSAGVQERAVRFEQMIRGGFETALTAVKSHGAVDPSFDVTAHAQVLYAASIGLNVAIRNARANAAGTAIAKSTAAMVRAWQKA